MKKLISLIALAICVITPSVLAKGPAKDIQPSIKKVICENSGANCQTAYFKSEITYIGTEEEALSLGFTENFSRHQIFFNPIFLDNKKTFSEEDMINKISTAIEEIKESDTIIINTNNFDSIFQTLGQLQKNDDIGLKNKTIYLSTDINKDFLKRSLAKYIKLIGVEKIYTLPEDEFLNFMSALSFGKIVANETYITNFSLTFQEVPKLLLISYLVDNLIAKGFPIELIATILLLTIGALVVSIFRQIIGFSSFGIYSPLLFALSIAALGIPISLGLLGIGAIAKILTNLFCKKIYLLHNAKTTMLIILYFLFLIIAVSLDTIFKTNLIDMNIFSTVFGLFPIVFVIIVTDKVFNEGFKIFSLGWLFSFIEFLIISFIVWGLFNWTWLKHLLLSYPEIIIIIFVGNIFIGRFTGLQLLEYFRFMPMISRHLDGEEE